MALRLHDRVAIVTGATRGIGRGIALALGSEGATVFTVGRSSGSMMTDAVGGTVESVAEEVTSRGGRGIPFRCDVRKQDEIEALFQTVSTTADGRPDLLVNNAWGGYENQPKGLSYDPFWKQPISGWDTMVATSVRAQIACSQCAVRMMLPRDTGLIVNTIAWGDGKYLLHLFYDLAKQMAVRVSYAISLELRRHGIASVALAPGFVRTERVMAAHAAHRFDLSGTESPEYTGRAVVALLTDENVMRHSGKVLTAGELSAAYGFTDVDDRTIPPFSFPEGLAVD